MPSLFSSAPYANARTPFLAEEVRRSAPKGFVRQDRPFQTSGHPP
jgi:hypothetical protein